MSETTRCFCHFGEVFFMKKQEIAYGGEGAREEPSPVFIWESSVWKPMRILKCCIVANCMKILDT